MHSVLQLCCQTEAACQGSDREPESRCLCWDFLVLFCCTAVPLKAGGYGEYRQSSYRALSGTADSERIFEQMMNSVI